MGSAPGAPEQGAGVALRRLLERGLDWIGPLGVAAAAYLAVRVAVHRKRTRRGDDSRFLPSLIHLL